MMAENTMIGTLHLVRRLNSCGASSQRRVESPGHRFWCSRSARRRKRFANSSRVSNACGVLSQEGEAPLHTERRGYSSETAGADCVLLGDSGDRHANEKSRPKDPGMPAIVIAFPDAAFVVCAEADGRLVLRDKDLVRLGNSQDPPSWR
jgi:hypothetical protein